MTHLPTLLHRLRRKLATQPDQGASQTVETLVIVLAVVAVALLVGPFLIDLVNGWMAKIPR